MSDECTFVHFGLPANLLYADWMTTLLGDVPSVVPLAVGIGRIAAVDSE